jgi:hypothetical protein
MTEDTEIEVEGMAVTTELGQAPFWMAFMMPGNAVDPVLLRSWIFDRVHTTSDVPPSISTIAYMEMLAKWIANGTEEEVKLRVVTSKPVNRPPEG